MGWVDGMIMRIISTEASCLMVTILLQSNVLFDNHSQWEYLTWRGASSEMPIFRHWRHSLWWEERHGIDTYGSLEVTFLAWRRKRINESIASSFQQVSTHSFWWWFLKWEKRDWKCRVSFIKRRHHQKKQRVAYLYLQSRWHALAGWQSTNSICVVPKQKSWPPHEGIMTLW
jgi:hypothetical protein